MVMYFTYILILYTVDAVEFVTAQTLMNVGGGGGGGER